MTCRQVWSPRPCSGYRKRPGTLPIGTSTSQSTATALAASSCRYAGLAHVPHVFQRARAGAEDQVEHRHRVLERSMELWVLGIPIVVGEQDADARFVECMLIEIAARARAGQILGGAALHAQVDQSFVASRARMICFRPRNRCRDAECRAGRGYEGVVDVAESR